MAESYSVQAVLSVKDKNFTSTLKNAERSLSNVGNTASSSSTNVGLLGTAFAVANTVISSACSAIKNSVSKAVERVDTLNQFPSIMENMGFSADDAEASINKLSDGIQGLPTALDDIVDSTQSIALITGNLDEATDVALALNDALIASGASTNEAASATEAYDKMLATGKVNSQNWTTLEQNMKYALQQVAEELGIASGNTQELYTAMQNGEITFDQFNSALVTCSEAEGGFADMAQTSSQGIQTSWENVKTAVVRGVANMIQAWNDAAEDNGLPTIQESLGVFRTVVDKVFGAASAAITVFVNNLDTIVAAVAPVVTAIAGFEIAKKAAEWLKNLKESGSKAADAMKNYKDTISKAKDKTGELKDAEQRAKNAADDLKDAQNRLADAIDKAADAKKQSKEANQELKEAEEKYQNIIKDESATVEEIKAAEENVATAKAKAETASENLTEALKKEKEAEQQKCDAANTSAAAEEILTDKQNEQAAAIEGSTLKAIAHNAILAVMSGEMGIAQAATEALNAAMDANPIGLVTTAISALVSVLGVVVTLVKKFSGAEDSAYSSSKKLKSKVDDLCDSLDESAASMDQNVENAKNETNVVKTLCDEVANLSTNHNKSTTETNTLKSAVAALCSEVDGLDLAYDEVTDSLNMSIVAMEAYCTAAMKQAEVNALVEDYMDTLSALEQIQQDIAEAEADAAAYEDFLSDSIEHGIEVSGLAAFSKRNQQDAIEELEAKEKEYTDRKLELEDQIQAAQDETTQAVLESSQLQQDAIQESIDNQCLTLEQLTEENQATVEALNSTWSDYVDQATNMFDVLDTEVETTVQDMIDNMQKNQEIMAQWGDNCESLRDRFANLGLDPAIIDQLVDLGPEGAGYIQELVDASDEELIELEETYSQGGETAYTAMCQSLGEGATEVISEVENLVRQTSDSFRTEVENADWRDTGESIPQGVAEGVESGAEVLFQATEDMGNTSITRFGAAIGWGSPAAEFVPAGESIPEGVAEGIKSSNAAVEAAEQLAETVIQAADEALSAADFSSAVDSMCSTIASATESGMKQVSKAVSDSMNEATKALNNGFRSMASNTTTDMNTIKSTVTNGMNSIKSTIQSVIESIKSNVTSQLNTIKSTVTSDMNTIKSTVTSAINTIKSTVTSGMNSIKSSVTSGMSSIKSTVSSTMNSCTNSVSNAMSSMRSAFSSGMNSCVSVARSCSSSIASAFSGLYSSLYSSGTSAMSGLQAGLNAGSGSVMSTARSIANSVTSTINSALKVGSPSKVLEDTGENAGEGLVIGLKNMLSKVKDVALEMADVVTDLAFGSFDAPNLAFEGGMTMSYYFDDAVVDALDDLTDALMDDDRVYEFTIPIEIDGREVAKATATFTQDELNKLEARSSRRDKFSISQ